MVFKWIGSPKINNDKIGANAGLIKKINEAIGTPASPITTKYKPKPTPVTKKLMYANNKIFERVIPWKNGMSLNPSSPLKALLTTGIWVIAIKIANSIAPAINEKHVMVIPPNPSLFELSRVKIP